MGVLFHSGYMDQISYMRACCLPSLTLVALFIIKTSDFFRVNGGHVTQPVFTLLLQKAEFSLGPSLYANLLLGLVPLRRVHPDLFRVSLRLIPIWGIFAPFTSWFFLLWLIPWILVWPALLAQVFPRPQLIFPFKTWFLGIYLNFQQQKSLKNQYLPHSESKSYQINSMKSCSSRCFQQHQRHIPIPPKFSATI